MLRLSILTSACSFDGFKHHSTHLSTKNYRFEIFFLFLALLACNGALKQRVGWYFKGVLSKKALKGGDPEERRKSCRRRRRSTGGGLADEGTLTVSSFGWPFEFGWQLKCAQALLNPDDVALSMLVLSVYGRFSTLSLSLSR